MFIQRGVFCVDGNICVEMHIIWWQYHQKYGDYFLTGLYETFGLCVYRDCLAKAKNKNDRYIPSSLLVPLSSVEVCSFCSRCACVCASLCVRVFMRYGCVVFRRGLQIWADGDAMVYCSCTCPDRSLHFRRRVKIVAGDVSVGTIFSRDKLVDGQLTVNIQ